MLRFFLPTLILLLTVACSENGSKTKKSGGDAGADGGNLDAGTDAGDIIVADLRYLPFATPGTRLEPRMMGFDGAPPIFVSWFDTMLGVECDARFAQDGKLRCLPRGSVAPITVRPASDCTGGSTLLDAQSCGLSGYDALATDLSEGQTTCANRGVGTQITLYASTPWPHGDYSEGSPGECVTTEVVPTGSVELTDPSTKNATDFVEFTTRFETIEPGGLGVMIQEGADGSARLLGGAVTDGVHCSYRDLGRKNLVCVPSEGVAFEEGSGTFTDDECTVYAAAVSPDYDETCRGEITLATRRAGLAGGGDIHDVTRELSDTDTVYVKDADDCVAMTVADLKGTKAWVGRLFEVSESPASLEEVHALSVGDGATATHLIARPDGIVIDVDRGWGPTTVSAAVLFEDRNTGLGCAPFPTDDGKLRCLPATAAPASDAPLLFADNLCKETVVSVWATSVPQTGRPSHVYSETITECAYPVGAGQETSQRAETLWKVLDDAKAPFYFLNGDKCTLSDDTETTGKYRVETADLTALPEVPVTQISP